MRDSGLVHALLGIADKETLLSHPVVGHSRVCFVIGSLLHSTPDLVQSSFCRTAGGAETDRLLVWPDGEKWAVEIKRSLLPKVGRGFHSAHEDLTPERSCIVYPGTERYRITETLEAISLRDLALELRGSDPG